MVQVCAKIAKEAAHIEGMAETQGGLVPPPHFGPWSPGVYLATLKDCTFHQFQAY